MSLSFDQDEKSTQDSRPVELFDFQFATGPIYRYCTYSRDVAVGGNIYKATQCKRSTLNVVQDLSNQSTATVELNVADPVVQAYMGVGMPPQTLKVTMSRLQIRSNLVEQEWVGYVASASMRGARTCVFTVSTQSDQPFGVQVPKVVCSRLCNHVLYDEFCQVIRNQISPLITSISGNTIGVTTIGAFGAHDFEFGEIVHLLTKERRTVVKQTGGTTLLIDVAFPTSVHVNDAVSLFPGCDHQVTTCRDRFGNVPNFGGHPHIRSSNFFSVDLRYSPIAK